MLEQKFNEISVKVVELYLQMSQAGFKASEEVFDRALDVYSSVGQFIEALEEADENMDPEKTKLPNIDGLFEAPVNDYVNASIQFAINGGKSAEKVLFEAAMNLAAYQEGYEPEEFKDEDAAVECGCEDGCCLAAEEESLLDIIYATEANHYDNVNVIMSLIEQGLDNAGTFRDEDFELIRYYLKHLPGNSDYDIDMLSDRALELAWKKHKYIRTIK